MPSQSERQPKPPTRPPHRSPDSGRSATPVSEYGHILGVATRLSEAVTDLQADRVALEPVTRRVREYADISPCEDCGLPTPYATGSYWLAPDDLWNDVVGTPAIVLCPPCFTERAEDKGISVSWRAVRDAA